MEQLTTLDVKPGDKGSAARYLASLKEELAKGKATRNKLKPKSRPSPVQLAI
jgi:hypothetical protein